MWEGSFTNAAPMLDPFRASHSPPCWNVSIDRLYRLLCGIESRVIFMLHVMNKGVSLIALPIQFRFTNVKTFRTKSRKHQQINAQIMKPDCSLNCGCRCWTSCPVRGVDGGEGGEEHGAADPPHPGWALQYVFTSLPTLITASWILSRFECSHQQLSLKDVSVQSHNLFCHFFLWKLNFQLRNKWFMFYCKNLLKMWLTAEKLSLFFCSVWLLGWLEGCYIAINQTFDVFHAEYVSPLWLNAP